MASDNSSQAPSFLSAWSPTPSLSGRQKSGVGVEPSAKPKRQRALQVWHHENSEHESRWVACSLSIPSLFSVGQMCQYTLPCPASRLHKRQAHSCCTTPWDVYIPSVDLISMLAWPIQPLDNIVTISKVVSTSVFPGCPLLYNATRREDIINPCLPLSHGHTGSSTKIRRSIKDSYTSISVFESMVLSQPRRPRLRFG